jgi:putative aldouronate transport system permease protein
MALTRGFSSSLPDIDHISGDIDTRGKMVRSKALRAIKKRLIEKHEWQLYLFALPVVIYFLIFNYLPMYGIVIAFKRYSIAKGIFESPWVGFLYFEKFFSSSMFWLLLKNTIVLSFYQLIVFFPFPIVLALMLNYTNNRWLKKFTQTVTYAPHFISIVVLVGMMFIFGSPSTGVINILLNNLGVPRVNFMGSEKWFSHIFVFSQVWQNTGYQAIIFLASLTAVDQSLYEAATIDGATKLQKIRYIDFPALLPTTVTLLLLQVGNLLNVSMQKALLMQTALNLGTSEIFGTYVYKIGLIDAQFSYSTAINLFQTLVNLVLLIVVNYASKKITEESLW